MSILTIIKLILIVLSGGLFAPPHSKEKVIAGIILLLGVVYASYDSIETIVLRIFSDKEVIATTKAELLHWESALKLHTTAVYQDYLDKYPNGEYKVQAEQAILALSDNKEFAVVEPIKQDENQWQKINRYLVKDDLVKDTQTHLMWQRCSVGQNWNGTSCEGDAKKYTWDNAMKLNNSSDSHYNDWRLPTHKELKTLVYCSSGQPTTWNSTINTDAKNSQYNGCTDNSGYTRPTLLTEVFPNMPEKYFWYWSASPVADDSNYALVVGFYNGDDDWDGKGSYYFVRLVRAGQ